MIASKRPQSLLEILSCIRPILVGLPSLLLQITACTLSSRLEIVQCEAIHLSEQFLELASIGRWHLKLRGRRFKLTAQRGHLLHGTVVFVRLRSARSLRIADRLSLRFNLRIEFPNFRMSSLSVLQLNLQTLQLKRNRHRVNVRPHDLR
ncbi:MULTISPECIES: hypothetical protein [Burkholderia]|uniref:hypothetical protein n=1 Tax=Burkholderia TaxID=32008 RepID=UPI00064EB77D|nr:MULTISPECIES: hypothetical protein [Burkholderia]